jgi:V-type H+-transporting ATPase subunit a
MILKPNYEAPKSIVMGSVLTVLAFVMFFIVTFGVIMCMDFMECFLHALRLHWVEF